MKFAIFMKHKGKNMQHSIVTDLVIILAVLQIGFVVWGLWIETQLKDLKKYMKRIDGECSRTEFRSLENDLKIKVSEQMTDAFTKEQYNLTEEILAKCKKKVHDIIDERSEEVYEKIEEMVKAALFAEKIKEQNKKEEAENYQIVCKHGMVRESGY